MDLKQIRALCIESAQTYYSYLSDHGKGCERIAVHRISAFPSGVYSLSLAKKIFDIETISFEINGFSYTTAQITVSEYDESGLFLTVRPRPEFEHILRSADLSRFYIISDLKFLVRRVEQWYRIAEHSIAIPSRNPSIAFDPSALPEGLSPEQQIAIEGILAHPFTYIWGAPGTGKTQFVLSNAALLYVNAGHKIVIAAPTNHSLDQSLYGVLSVLQKNDFPLDRVLRLGIPTLRFSESFPQCCEFQAVNKHLSQLEEQKALLQKKLRRIPFRENYLLLKTQLMPTLNELKSLCDERQSVIAQYDECRADLRINEQLSKQLQNESREISNQVSVLDHEMSSSLFPYKRFLFPRSAKKAERRRQELFQSLLVKQNGLKPLASEGAVLHERLKQLEQSDAAYQDEIAALISKAQHLAADIPKFRSIISTLTFQNVHAATDALYKLQKDAEELLAAPDAPKESDDYESLSEKLDEINLTIDRISAKSTAQRMNKVQIIAVTIDSFISRYDSELLSFHPTHIFLDEAGYCSLIKGITLLSKNCPVSFLGDHMQLAPVCEMNDDKFNTSEYSPVFLWAQSVLAAESLFAKDFAECLEQYLHSVPPDFLLLQKLDLTATYRFGGALSSILDNYVYRNGFHSALANADFDIRILPAKRLPKRRPGAKKRENLAEADAVASWLASFSPDDFAVLSPYTNQIKLLNVKLPQARQEQRIMTVHASQGREWENVILSVSDTSDKWFTDSARPLSLRLLNTAVSRAKRRLVIACDAEYWLTNPEQFISALIKSARSTEKEIYHDPV